MRCVSSGPEVADGGDPVDPARTCAWCGTTGSGAALLTWTSSVERDGTRWYCAACSREHLRSIEGKLDSEWW